MMRKSAALLLLAAFTSAACGGGGSPTAAAPVPSPTPAPRANIIWVVLDDLDFDAVLSMNRTRSLLGASGTTFANAIVATPLCGPSRASMFSGQYTHNNGFLGNADYPTWRERGYNSNNIGPWMKAAGYRTGLFGKYLNNFPSDVDTFIPPGWDDWAGVLSDRVADNYIYSINVNGVVSDFFRATPEQYQTDFLAARLSDFLVRAEANDSQPFFAVLAPGSPHAPPEPAERHRGAYAGTPGPRPPSLNEDEVGDKPRWLQRAPYLDDKTLREIDALFAERLESLMAVDEAMERLVQQLTTLGELDNTYIFFTSDNGAFHGQHRISGGKGTLYEEAIRVPLMVRGPRVGAGRTVTNVVGNIDFAPTFLEIAGAAIPGSVDGRSMLPLLNGQARTGNDDVLVEGLGTGSPLPSPAFVGVRTPDAIYGELATGEFELYDLRSDPFQLENLGVSNPPLLDRLRARLAVLKTCAGASCR